MKVFFLILGRVSEGLGISVVANNFKSLITGDFSNKYLVIGILIIGLGAFIEISSKKLSKDKD